MSPVDILVLILIVIIAGAFVHWIYEHVVRFFSFGAWRRCPECDRVILREAKSCERCGADLGAPTHRAA